MTWRIGRSAGPAGLFHARPMPERVRRSVWIHTVTAPALVLGSSQPESHLDLEACRSAGVEVVRRRSGGGAVLLEPGDVLWLDVLIGRDDALWSDDVSRSFSWLGELWARALGAAGVRSPQVHGGAMVRSEWSGAVCFAGLGAGEVTVGGCKVVGMSQRRTAAGARFQCAALAAWRPEHLRPLLAEPWRAGDWQDAAAGCAVPLKVLEDRFLAFLPT